MWSTLATACHEYPTDCGMHVRHSGGALRKLKATLLVKSSNCKYE
ncbi:MAG: hypothetical protein ABFD50_21195 [Smithella sp.]